MLLPSWWKQSLRTVQRIKRDRPRKNRQGARTHVPRLETLEDRIAPANWSGDISSNTTWSNTQVQNITGNVRVDPGVKLTVQAGTVVHFNGGTSLTVDGTLLAQGTSSQTIFFTSYRDNSPLGGSNSAGKGDWGDIQFNSDSKANVLGNTEVNYGGGNGAVGAIVDNAAPLTLSNSDVGNSYTAGMRIVRANPTLAGDTFLNNNGAAISMDLASDPNITTVSVNNNNNINGVELDSGSLVSSESWNNSDIVYWMSGSVTVPQGDTLTVAAGQIVKVAGGDNNLIVNGTLTAPGTMANPVVFTSYRDDTVGGDTNNNGATTGSRGDWGSIQFTSSSAANVLNDVQVFFGGGYSEVADVVDTDATLTFNNGMVGNSYTAGMRIVGANPTLAGDTFLNNNGAAISMDLASDPNITGVSVNNNNNINGVELDSGSLVSSESWNNPDIVYWMSGSVTVPQGDTLTVAAGQIVKVAGGDNNLIVNGTLTAPGTTANPVVFTSYRDDTVGGDTNNNGATTGSRGDWGSIQFTSSSAANVLNDVQVFFGGGYSEVADVVDTDATLTFNNGMVGNSYTAGMRIVGANPTLAGDTFLNNNGAAISMDLASDPNITTVSVNNNNINGVELDSGSLVSNESWNNSDIVYWMSGNVTVPPSDTLAIGAGQIVKVAGGDNNLIVNGTLTAPGTTANPVVFTSYRDDTVGGDTNNNGATTGSRGDWGSIQFTSSSAANVLNDVQVFFGGGNGEVADVVDTDATLTFNNGVVGDSYTAGMRIVGANPTLAGDTFLNNNGAAISMDLASQPVINAATNYVQTVTLTGSPTGGTFTLSFGGQTTSAIPYNASALTVQNDLQALSTILTGNISVSGGSGAPYVCTFIGSLAGMTEPLMTASGSGLTGGSSPGVTVTGNLTNNGVNGVLVDGGTLYANTSWNNPTIVYLLSGNVTVGPGVTLTIGAGQIVKMAGGNNNLIVNGVLLAQGTMANPIVFTSYRDDTFGGDTNNNGPTTGNRGDWGSIEFASGSSGSVLNDVDVRFGGTSFSGEIFVQSAGLSLTNSTIENSNQAGLRIQGSSPTVTNDIFQNNNGAAVSIDSASTPAITGATYTGNGTNGVATDSSNMAGYITSNTTWSGTMTFNSNVRVNPGVTLTIMPGTIVVFAHFNNSGITVDGTLNAVGTSGSPIIFTSDRDTLVGGSGAGNGDWSGIQFNSDSTANVLSFVQVRYAGENVAGAVLVQSANLSLTNSTIENSGNAGLRVQGSAPTVTGDTFQNNSGAAVSMDLASTPIISGPPTVTGNGINGVALDGGTIEASNSWNNPGIVYDMTGNVTVAAGATLTIGAGQIVKVVHYGAYALTVNGTLQAGSTAGQPVIFTSDRDDSAGGDTNNDGASTGSTGDWSGLVFTSGSSGNSLANVDVRDGGESTTAEVIVQSAGLSLTNSTIESSNHAGLRIQGSSPTLTGDTFKNSGGAAVSMDLASTPIISGPPTVTGNGINGVALDGGTIEASNSWNNPGIVYDMTGNVTVAAGATLTIGAGQIVKVVHYGAYALTVNGTLQAGSTAGQPVIFTSDRDDSAGGDTNNDGASSGSTGDWSGLVFTSGSSGNSLTNVDVRDGGESTTAEVIVQSAGLSLTNSTIESSNHAGLRIQGSSPTLTGDTFKNSGGAAVSMDLASTPTISGPPTVTGNGINGVALDGGTIEASNSWNNPGIVYDMTGNVTVAAGVTLTIGAGQIVKVVHYGAYALTVNGTLQAGSTAGQPVIFTSDRDDSAGGDTNNDGASTGSTGDWSGLMFTSGSSGNNLTNVDVRDGGESTTAEVIVQSAGLSLTNSTIESSNHAGLRIQGSSPTLTGDTFQNNSGAAISMDLASQPKITSATNYVQTVTVTGSPTGGSFTLTFNTETTAAIPYNASAATVQADLQALSTIGAGNIAVSGINGGPYVCTFSGSLSGVSEPLMTASSSGLTGGTPGVTVTGNTTNNGVNGVLIDGGIIYANTSWNNPTVVYDLNGNVTVAAGATLTISAGQIVKVVHYGGYALAVNGALQAGGTAGQPIIFTSDRDDSVGGDTNNDGASTGSTGDWSGLQFNSGSSGNSLANVDVRDGGENVVAEVMIQSAGLSLTNSIIETTDGAALRIQGSDPTLAGDTFRNNSGPAISMDLSSNPMITGEAANLFTGNSNNGLVLDSGTATINLTWNNNDIVYTLGGSVNIPNGLTLTVSPGQVIKANGAALNIDGTIAAQGTAVEPVTFTSLYDNFGGTTVAGNNTPNPGNWSGLQLNSDSSANVLDHVQVYYGSAGINDNGGPLTLSQSIVSSSSGAGLNATNGAQAQLTNDLILSNNNQGITADTGAVVNAINDTIDANQTGVQIGSATVTLTNDLITNSSSAGVNKSQSGGTVNVSFSDVFNPRANSGNYENLTDPTGSNGDISADPLYVNAAEGQYGLSAGSSAIDTGTSNGAPAVDIYDNPRTVGQIDMGALQGQLQGPTALTTAITFPETGGDYNAAGWQGTITGSALGLSSGVEEEQLSIFEVAANKYWNGSSFASNAEVFLTATLASPGAASTTWTLSFPESNFPADGSYTVHALATDGDDNVEVTGMSVTFTIATVAPVVTLAVTPNFTTPIFSGSAGTAPSDLNTVTVTIWNGTSPTGTPVETLPTTANNGSYFVAANVPLTPGNTYTAQASQTDVLGNIGLSLPSTFTVQPSAPNVSLNPVSSPTKNSRPTFSGTADTAPGDSNTISVSIYSGTSASGTPVESLTATVSNGGYSVQAATGLNDGTYTAQARQSDSTGDTGYSGTTTFLVDTLAIAPVTLAAGTVGASGYAQTITVTGGVGNLTLALTQGELPNGLGLSPTTGAAPNGIAASLSGTPTLAGTFNFTLTASDGAGQSASQSFTLLIHPNAPVVAQGVSAFSLTEGSASLNNVVLATFTDPGNPTGAPGDYTATVNWGDGHSDTSGTPPTGSGITVEVGYADSLRPSGYFPSPWNGNPNVVFNGSPAGSQFDAGAIRIINNGSTAITVNDVSVNVAGVPFDLWGSNVIPAGDSLILTQTNGENFDSSDEPHGGYNGGLLPYPQTYHDGDTTGASVIDITVNGVLLPAFLDTGHVLTTGGSDLGEGTDAQGNHLNESQNWRLIGTTGISNPGGSNVTIVNNHNGTFSVVGSHEYVGDTISNGSGESEGTAAITVTINHDATTPQVVNDSANIADPPVMATGVPAFSLTEGSASLNNQLLATFTDPGNPGGNMEDADDYSATVNWGDGTIDTSGGAPSSGSAPITVEVGYADSLRPNAFFPSPWQGSADTTFVGDSSVDFDAGAIRIINNTSSSVTVNDVKVTLANGVTYDLWGSNALATGGNLILTQTDGENFDTSDADVTLSYPQTYSDGETAHAATIAVTINGVVTTYQDTGHVLTTGGSDPGGAGINESQNWRPVGTTGESNPGGSNVTIVNNGDGTFSVIASHEFMGDTIPDGDGESEGTAAISVTINHDATTPQVVNDTANIADLPVTVQPPPPAFPLVEGSASLNNAVLATFTDPGNPGGNQEDTGDYTATVNWGDGHSDTSGTPPTGSGITVQVGYADSLRPSGFFPSPWNGDPNVVFNGSPAGSQFDGGAIRIINNGTTAITVNDVSVTIPGASPLDLWGNNNVIPAGESLILTQTNGENFDTSDLPHGGYNGGELPYPQTYKDGDTTGAAVVDITVNGTLTTFLDTGHILTTGGSDYGEGTDSLGNHLNESFNWRQIGTTGISNPGGSNVTIRNNGDGTFSVIGSHDYVGDSVPNGSGESEGTAAITVTINHDATTPQVVNDSANIIDPPVIASGVSAFSFTQGAATINNALLATFTDPGDPAGNLEDAGDYSATVTWGDNSSDATGGANLVIVNNGNGTFSVKGTHTYTGAGQETITVTINHDATTPQVVTDTVTISPSGLFSDSFNRSNATEFNLGKADNALGGSGSYFYVPVFPAGASIASNTLQNNGLDFGGVQFTTSSSTSATRGTNVGQDLDITVSLLVPTDSAGDISEAGVYFRSRAAFTNDGIIGGQAFDPSGGYWVRLVSNGMVEVVDLRNNTIAAFTAQPPTFDPTVFHTLQIAAQGNNLQVALDGVLQQFDQGGNPTTTVAIPATGLPGDTTLAGDVSAGNAGTAGISFGDPLNRGKIGGEEADNLVVTGYSPLSVSTNGALLVTNTSDSGAGSLRQAITDSNNGLSPAAAIQFAISESGVQTITPATQLPAISTAVNIEGNTEPFFSVGKPLVEINGATVGTSGAGLVLTGNNSTIRGLSVVGFTAAVDNGVGQGIDINGGSGNKIVGNFIGVAPDGNTAAGNYRQGIEVQNGSGNTIGGTTAADRNVIGGQIIGSNVRFDSSNNNVVEGNYIGINAAGTAALIGSSSGVDGVVMLSNSSGNTIGGTAAGAGNVISGNQYNAVGAFGSNNVVEGNFLGTNATLTQLIANSSASGTTGVDVSGTNETISGNLIGGFTLAGIRVLDGGTTGATITSNAIGTNFSGTATNLGNPGDGILFTRNGGPSGNTVGGTSAGAGNIIAFNGGHGVNFDQGSNSALGNSIYANKGPEIFLNAANSANENLPAPVVTTATINGGTVNVAGTFTAVTAGDNYRLEFFASVGQDASGASEGQQFLGSQTLSAVPAGTNSFTAALSSLPTLVGNAITATVTDLNVNAAATSPFSGALAPTVLTVTPSVPTVTGAQVGSNGFSLTVSYNEPMNTSVSPTISISPSASATLTPVTPGTWDATHTAYTQSYNVVSANVNVAAYSVTVSGAQSAAGITQVAYTQNNVFGINTSNPVVVSVTPSMAIITKAQAGSTFKLALLFNESMKTSVAPTITFSPSISSTLMLLSGKWSSANRTYTASYKVANAGQFVPGVGVTVTGAQDADGNTQLTFNQSGIFTIDMASPTVTSITPSVATITDAQLGKATFTLGIQYSTAMNVKVAPTISFNPSISSTLARVAGSWDSTHSLYTAVFNVADAYVNVPAVAVTLSGAMSSDGNTAASKTQTGDFAIDTVNPTVKSVTPSVPTITDALVGNANFTIAVQFSGVMNTAVAPTLGFVPKVDSTLSFASGSWNSAKTVYTAVYNVANAGMIIPGVAVYVSGGQNIDGNVQHNLEKTGVFNINTDAPAVVSLTPSANPITNAQVGKKGFTIQVVYDEAMNTKVNPTITFSPDVSSTLTIASGKWDSSRTIYTATYNVANAAVSILGVQATVTNGKNTAGNLQDPFVQGSAFDISTTATGGPDVSVTATNTTASVNSNYFGESFVPTVSGALTQLNVLDITNLYSGQGQSLTSANATIQIYSGGINTSDPTSSSYDTPAGTLLYSQNFTFTIGNNDIVFTTPPMLTAGQTYLWRVVSTGVSTIYVDFATNNPYPQGDTLAGPGFGYDLPFQTFM